MIWEEAAQGFAAMGSEARLQVLRCLVRAGEPGLSVSEIQDRTGMAPSTLALTSLGRRSRSCTVRSFPALPPLLK